METNIIYNEDCIQGLKKLPDKSIDLIITDPPYGINFQSNYRKEKHKEIVGDDHFPVEIMNEFFRITKRAVYVFCRWDNLRELPKPRSVIAWVKNNWSMGDLQHEHGRQWEAICFYPQEEHKFIRRIPDVIHCNRTGNELHPTQKPKELIKKIIDANKGDIILDPFMGSGTTAVACKELNRRWVGFEINPEYYTIAERRLKQETMHSFFETSEQVPTSNEGN